MSMPSHRRLCHTKVRPLLYKNRKERKKVEIKTEKKNDKQTYFLFHDRIPLSQNNQLNETYHSNSTTIYYLFCFDAILN